MKRQRLRLHLLSFSVSFYNYTFAYNSICPCLSVLGTHTMRLSSRTRTRPGRNAHAIIITICLCRSYHHKQSLISLHLVQIPRYEYLISKACICVSCFAVECFVDFFRLSIQFLLATSNFILARKPPLIKIEIPTVLHLFLVTSFLFCGATQQRYKERNRLRMIITITQTNLGEGCKFICSMKNKILFSYFKCNYAENKQIFAASIECLLAKGTLYAKK